MQRPEEPASTRRVQRPRQLPVRTECTGPGNWQTCGLRKCGSPPQVWFPSVFGGLPSGRGGARLPGDPPLDFGHRPRRRRPDIVPIEHRRRYRLESVAPLDRLDGVQRVCDRLLDAREDGLDAGGVHPGPAPPTASVAWSRHPRLAPVVCIDRRHRNLRRPMESAARHAGSRWPPHEPAARRRSGLPGAAWGGGRRPGRGGGRRRPDAVAASRVRPGAAASARRAVGQAGAPTRGGKRGPVEVTPQTLAEMLGAPAEPNVEAAGRKRAAGRRRRAVPHGGGRRRGARRRGQPPARLRGAGPYRAPGRGHCGSRRAPRCRGCAPPPHATASTRPSSATPASSARAVGRRSPRRASQPARRWPPRWSPPSRGVGSVPTTWR